MQLSPLCHPETLTCSPAPAHPVLLRHGGWNTWMPILLTRQLRHPGLVDSRKMKSHFSLPAHVLTWLHPVPLCHHSGGTQGLGLDPHKAIARRLANTSTGVHGASDADVLACVLLPLSLCHRVGGTILLCLSQGLLSLTSSAYFIANVF